MEKDKGKRVDHSVDIVNRIEENGRHIREWINNHNREFRNGCFALMMTSTILLSFIGFRSTTQTYRYIREIPSSLFCQNTYIPPPFRGLIGKIKHVKEEDGLVFFEHYPYRKIFLYSIVSSFVPKAFFSPSTFSPQKSIKVYDHSESQDITNPDVNILVNTQKNLSIANEGSFDSDNLLAIKLFGISYDTTESHRSIHRYIKDLQDKNSIIRIHLLFESDEILYVQLQHGLKRDLANHLILSGIGQVETESDLEKYNLYENVSASSFKHINKQYKALLWRQKVASFLKRGIWEKKDLKTKRSIFHKLYSFFMNSK